MEKDKLNAEPLWEEYRTIVKESLGRGDSATDWLKLHRKLCRTGEWTDPAASHLVALARNYGSFMLRNALALAVAAGIEDGELRF
jgi:hypothetical protein